MPMQNGERKRLWSRRSFSGPAALSALMCINCSARPAEFSNKVMSCRASRLRGSTNLEATASTGLLTPDLVLYQSKVMNFNIEADLHDLTRSIPLPGKRNPLPGRISSGTRSTQYGLHGAGFWSESIIDLLDNRHVRIGHHCSRHRQRHVEGDKSQNLQVFTQSVPLESAWTSLSRTRLSSSWVPSIEQQTRVALFQLFLPFNLRLDNSECG